MPHPAHLATLPAARLFGATADGLVFCATADTRTAVNRIGAICPDARGPVLASLATGLPVLLIGVSPPPSPANALVALAWIVGVAGVERLRTAGLIDDERVVVGAR